VKHRQLGSEALRVSEIGLGVPSWDTAGVYGAGHNEEPIGSSLKERACRDRVVLATQLGFLRMALSDA